MIGRCDLEEAAKGREGKGRKGTAGAGRGGGRGRAPEEAGGELAEKRLLLDCLHANRIMAQILFLKKQK